MSREYVETTKELLHRWSAGDWEWIRGLAAPDLEYDMSRAVGPINGVHGLDGARRTWTEFASHWDAMALDAETMIESGDDVVVSLTIRGRGRDGIEVRTRTGWVISYRDGKLMRMEMFQNFEEALAAAAEEG